MTVNAIVAVHPDVDVQFDDAELMGTFPAKTQEVIAKAKANVQGFKGLTVDTVEYNVYNVYGNTDDLDYTVAQFSPGSILPLGSWHLNGNRYGTYITKTISAGIAPSSINIPATNISESTYTIKRWVYEEVQVDDGQGGQTTELIKVLKTITKTKSGYVDVIHNDRLVATVKITDLNPDGSYDFQELESIIVEELLEGTPSIQLHPQLIDIMPDDITYDENGNEISRATSASLKQVVLKAGQKPRVFT